MPSPLKRLNSHQKWRATSWPQQFQLDDHSLALFRIGLGLASLINVIVRATTAEFLPSILLPAGIFCSH
jgi:hypothetical protein